MTNFPQFQLDMNNYNFDTRVDRFQMSNGLTWNVLVRKVNVPHTHVLIRFSRQVLEY